jgi:hypothetical protein
MESMRIIEGSHHSNHIVSSPGLISFAFPIGIAGAVGISIGKETETNVKYQSEEETIPGSSFKGRISYDNKGGSTGWRIGWGRAIGKWAYAGATYERIQFIQNSTKIVELPLFPANSSRDSVCNRFIAHALHLGVIVPVGKLGIGLTGRYIFETDLKYTRGQYSGFDTTAIFNTDSTAYAAVQMPPYIGLGLSYEFTPRLLMAADMKITAWNEYFSGGYLPSVDLQYGLTFGAGIRYVPAPDVLSPKYAETIQYRAGINVQQLPSQGATEGFLSLGAGFPTRGGGLVDLVISGGRRVDADFGNYSENIARIAIGINGGRKWSKAASDTY